MIRMFEANAGLIGRVEVIDRGWTRQSSVSDCRSAKVWRLPARWRLEQRNVATSEGVA